MPVEKDSYCKAYWFLLCLRVVLVIIPQVGYIHPDEYFQSVEILAGKFFDVEINPPWEFNSKFPIRSMAIPYFTIGVCLKFLRDINNVIKGYYPEINLIKPYYMLVVPRLLMCLFSFFVDYCLYKICVNNNEKYKHKLVILASSYVMIIYGTRTFSNTTEMVLFAVLLYYVCESLTFSNMNIKKKEYINFRYNTSTNVSDRVKFHRLKNYLSSDSLRNVFPISTITVLGFFNRPTFLAYALFPVFFWLYRGIGSKLVNTFLFYARILAVILCSIPTIMFIVICDSFYYGYISWGEIGMLDISINNFIFTPLNFLKYNLNNENLAKHGLHPRYLHVLVNIPLLYNILGIFAIFAFLKYLEQMYQGKFNLLPSVRSIKCLMVMSSVAPVLILSYFPHQEPRFLIPIMLPLAYLHGASIYKEHDNVVVELPKKKHGNSSAKTNPEGHLLLKLWLIFNLVLIIFYGFIHQGGVYPATAYVSNELHKNQFKEYHLVTSHIYSMPESFFLQKSSTTMYMIGNKKYHYKKRFFMYELQSKSLKDSVNDILRIFDGIRKKNPPKTRNNYRVLMLIPTSLEDEIKNIGEQKNIIFDEVKTFYPHLTVEAFPNFGKYCLDFLSSAHDMCISKPLIDYFSSQFTQCGLRLYELDKY